MKRFFALCGGSLLVVLLLLAVAVRAEEIKNQYFTLDLPSGWIVKDRSVRYITWSWEKKRRLDDVNITETVVTVADSSTQSSVSIVVTILPETTSADMFCNYTSRLRMVEGFSVGEPVALGESYAVELTQGVEKSWQIYTVSDLLASTVTIVGEGGKEVMQKHFRPVDPKLFPASYEGVLIQSQ